jgi:hypothetical protein
MKIEGFSVSQKMFFFWGHFQNVFAPKAAGWTQALAFENKEIQKIVNFQDIAILLDQMAQTRGPRSCAMCFRTILSSQFFQNCHMEYFLFWNWFSNTYSKAILAPIGSES